MEGKGVAVCELASESIRERRFELPDKHHRTLLMDETLGQNTRVQDASQFQIYSANYDELTDSDLQLHGLSNILRNSIKLVNDHGQQCRAASNEEVKQTREWIGEFFEFEQDLCNSSGNTLSRAHWILHIVLHVNHANLFFTQVGRDKIVVVLGGLVDLQTRFGLHQSKGILFHELGHMLLRAWVPTFPYADISEIRAIDEGLADTISLLALPQANELLQLRTPDLIPKTREVNDPYYNAAFVSGFILYPRIINDRIQRLMDVVESIRSILGDKTAVLSLCTLFGSLHQAYQDDPAFKRVMMG